MCTSTAACRTPVGSAALSPSPAALWQQARSCAFWCRSAVETFLPEHDLIFSVTVLEQMVINTMCGQGMQILEYSEAATYIHTNGCIDKLVNWIHSNMFLLGGIAMGLAIPQVGAHLHWLTHFPHSYFGWPLFLPPPQLVGILLSQILINQIKDQIELQRYNLKHHSDPWSWPQLGLSHGMWAAISALLWDFTRTGSLGVLAPNSGAHSNCWNAGGNSTKEKTGLCLHLANIFVIAPSATLICRSGSH